MLCTPPSHVDPQTATRSPPPAAPLQVLWTFSIYLEAVAIFPQLFVLHRTSKIENFTCVPSPRLDPPAAPCLARVPVPRVSTWGSVRCRQGQAS